MTVPERRLADAALLLIPDLEAAVVRLPVACLAAAVTLFLYLTSPIIIWPASDTGINIVQTGHLIASAGFAAVMLSMSAAFLAEARRITRAQGIAAGAIASIVLAGIAALSNGVPHLMPVHPLYLASGGILALFAAAAGSSRRASFRTCVLVAVRSIMAAAIALVIVNIFNAMTTVSSARSPFDFFILPKTMQVLVMALVLVYCANWLPQPDREPENHDTGFEAVLLRCIFMPIALLVIAVFIPIMAIQIVNSTGSLNVNGRAIYPLEISNTVLIALTFVYLAARPGPDQLNGDGLGYLVRWYSCLWQYLMIVPVCFSMIGLFQNLSPFVDEQTRVHGATFSFYNETLIGLWITAFALAAMALRNSRNLQLFIGTAAAVCLLSSFGPWSSGAFAQHYAVRQLQSALTSLQYLKGERLDRMTSVPPESSCPSSGAVAPIPCRSIIYGNLQILQRLGGLRLIEPWFRDLADNPFVVADAGSRQLAGDQIAARLISAFGPYLPAEVLPASPLPPIPSPTPETPLDFSASAVLDMPLGMHAFAIGPLQMDRFILNDFGGAVERFSATPAFVDLGSGATFGFAVTGDRLTIKDSSGAFAEFDFKEFVLRSAAGGTAANTANTQLKRRSGALQAEVWVLQLHGTTVPQRGFGLITGKVMVFAGTRIPGVEPRIVLQNTPASLMISEPVRF